MVGNPPYHRIQGIPTPIKDYLIAFYPSATGKFDLSVVFVERGYRLLESAGQMGLIIPNKPLTADYGSGFRKVIAGRRALARIVDFEHTQIFPEASIYACLLFLSGSMLSTTTVTIAPSGRFDTADHREVSIREFTERPWSLRARKAIKPATVYHTLGQTCEAIFQGLISGGDPYFIGRPSKGYSDQIQEDFPLEAGITKPVLKGKHIRRFRIQPSGEYVIYPYENVTGNTKLLSENVLQDAYPVTYSYLSRHRSILSARGSVNMHYPAWYALWNPRQIERFQRPKLLTQVLANKATFAIDPAGEYWFVGGGNAGVYGIIPKPDLTVDIWFLLGYLNSTFFDQYVKSVSSRFRGGFYSYAKRFIQSAPVRVTGLSTQEYDAVTHVGNLVRSGYDQTTSYPSIWPEVDRIITELHAA